MIITLYKSGPGDEKWTKPDLSSHLLYTGLCKPGGMIRKYGGHQPPQSALQVGPVIIFRLVSL